MNEYTTECLAETKAVCLASLDEIAREEARRMLELALQAEVDEYVQRAKEARDERGRALVVRNGRARERTVILGIGELRVRAPRVDDRRLGGRFTSRILPPYMRRSPRVDTVAPVVKIIRSAATVSLGAAAAVLEGVINDGGQVSQIVVWVQTPSGGSYSDHASMPEKGRWVYHLTPIQSGVYTLCVRAKDRAGNSRGVGPFQVMAYTGPEQRGYLPLIRQKSVNPKAWDGVWPPPRSVHRLRGGIFGG
jgi:hypothetical protein